MNIKGTFLLTFFFNKVILGYTQMFHTSSFPYPFYYQTGDEVVVTCWIPQEYEFQRWVLPSNESIYITSGRYYLERAPRSVTLRVINSTATDAGAYTCYASHDKSNDSSTIFVYHADPIMMYSSSVNATVNVGESQNFLCNATNFVFHQWQYSVPDKRAVVLSNTSDGRVTITPDFELQLRDVQFDNEGMYSCVVVNHLGRHSLRNNLTVIAPLEIYVGSNFEEMMENSSVILTCIVTGVPQPTILWKDRSGQVIQSSDGKIVTSDVVNASTVMSKLVLQEVSCEHSGLYICLGSNKHDNSSFTVKPRRHDCPTLVTEHLEKKNISSSYNCCNEEVPSYVWIITGSIMLTTVLAIATITVTITIVKYFIKYKSNTEGSEHQYDYTSTYDIIHAKNETALDFLRLNENISYGSNEKDRANAEPFYEEIKPIHVSDNSNVKSLGVIQPNVAYGQVLARLNEDVEANNICY